jgi:hypothetical protein
MKRLLTVAVLGLSLVAFGCAGTQAKGDEAITKDTTVRCPKCGATFKVGEGLWERR